MSKYIKKKTTFQCFTDFMKLHSTVLNIKNEREKKKSKEQISLTQVLKLKVSLMLQTVLCLNKHYKASFKNVTFKTLLSR